MEIKAIEMLKEEHRMIDELVDILDTSIDRAERPDGLSPHLIDKEIEFCRDFIGKWHEMKEEEILIPELQRRGYPLDRGPIFDTIEDHRKGRSILRRLVATGKISDPNERVKSFAKFASAYSLYLYEHIREEEGGLLHAAELSIEDQDKEEIDKKFSKINKELDNKGGREKYKRILESRREELDNSAR
ncbi:MAG: hemerythrin domain-containing protein [Thermoplasmata archaeon]|nr:hemerythrin domain-containing protein [Thermoplasmata archaeon]